MNKILNIFLNEKRRSVKHKNYFQVYEEYLNKYIKKKITFVEIGVANGGSLRVWKKYFKNARIIGVDLNNECKVFEEKKIEIIIGDQADPLFWKKFFKKVGKVDIILDDGGHHNLQQITTMSECIPNIKDGGLLIVEDTVCSYLKAFGNPNQYSFINFSKKIIDDINFNNKSLGHFNFSLNKYIHSAKFYESIVVFEINRKKIVKNSRVDNKGVSLKIQDYRDKGIGLINNKKITFLIKKLQFLKKNKLYFIFYKFLSSIFNIYKNKILIKKQLKKYFE